MTATREAVQARVPGDKSVTHRALILGALADGTSEIRGALDSADTRATLDALRALGVTAHSDDISRLVIIEGVGRQGPRAPATTIDCGNSGTTARLLLGALAGQRFAATVDGDASLRGRPMRRVTDPLERMGAGVDWLGEPDRLPVRVRGGALETIRYESPHASAQVKSAILLAGFVGGVPVQVSEPAQSRDHTERMLGAMGADLHARQEAGRWVVDFEPPDTLAPLRADMPGDFSAAAYFIALGLLGRGPELRVAGVGVNPTRTGLLDVLERMGARIDLEAEREMGNEPVADLIVRPSTLRATSVAADEIPRLIDELPVLAILAARAEGETRIEGASELRVKESDRLAALANNLQTLGVDAEQGPDTLTVRGTDAPLRGTVLCEGDHRIAMAFGTLGETPDTEIRVDSPGAVDVSFPEFWERLRAAARAYDG